MPSSIIIIVTLLIFICAVLFFRASQTHYPFPPGPTRIPFLGNLHQLSPLRPHPQFLMWAQKYGPIFYLQLGPQNLIALNSADVADQLLVSRSKTYSSRPRVHVAQDIMSNGQRLGFLPYGDEFKAARKSLQPFLGSGQSEGLRLMQDMESHVLLYDLMNHGDKSLRSGIIVADDEVVPPGHWFLPIRRYAASVVTILTYGKRMHTTTNDDDFLKLFEIMTNLVKVAQPGNYLADVFSVLRKLPDWLAPWRVAAKRMHIWEIELYGGFVEEVQTELNHNKDNQSYVGSYLRERAESGTTDAPGIGLTNDGWMRNDMLAYVAGTMVEAGADTTSVTLQTVILQLLGNAAALRKAREEIDREIGPHRMPNFDDEARLPYVVACIKESLRCRPPVPLGLPHSLDEDDIWDGYLIPKGSTVVGNIWAIHMDPIRYPDPTTFNPDRFLLGQKAGRWGGGPDSKDRDQLTMRLDGVVDSGSATAEASLFIGLSRILWGLEFWAPFNLATGKDILPDMKDERMFNDGFSSFPRAFSVGFQARSEGHAAIIRSAYEDAQTEFEVRGFARDHERLD